MANQDKSNAMGAFASLVLLVCVPFCAWMSARLFTAGWISFILLFIVILFGLLIVFMVIAENKSEPAASKSAIIAALLLIVVNHFAGPEKPLSPAQTPPKPQPVAEVKKPQPKPTAVQESKKTEPTKTAPPRPDPVPETRKPEPVQTVQAETKKPESAISDETYLEKISGIVSLIDKNKDTALEFCSGHAQLIAVIEEKYRDNLRPYVQMERQHGIDFFNGTSEGREFMKKFSAMKAKEIEDACNDNRLKAERDKLLRSVDSITLTMKQLTNPPQRYVTLHAKVVDLYGAFGQIMKYAMNPPKSPDFLELFSRGVLEAGKEYGKARDAVQILIPSVTK